MVARERRLALARAARQDRFVAQGEAARPTSLLSMNDSFAHFSARRHLLRVLAPVSACSYRPPSQLQGPRYKPPGPIWRALRCVEGTRSLLRKAVARNKSSPASLRSSPVSRCAARRSVAAAAPIIVQRNPPANGASSSGSAGASALARRARLAVAADATPLASRSVSSHAG